jgi:Glycosyl transferase family 2
MSSAADDRLSSVPRSEAVPISGPVLGRHIDSATIDEDTGDLLVAGWALRRDSPRARVIAIADGRSLGHVRADRARSDIAEAFPDVEHAGQSGFRLRLPAPLAKDLGELEIAMDGAAGELIPIWKVRFTGSEEASGDSPAPTDEPARRRTRRRGVLRALAPAKASSRRAETEHGDDAGDRQPPAPAVAEEPFRVVAIVSAYNEADVIEPMLDHLTSQGISAYLLDDGSTDDTVERAQAWLGRGLLAIERIAKPPDAKTSWRSILARKLELARELGADWYIHHDADEFRESPWPGTSLSQAIRWVDRLGYNAIDFRVLNFPPVDDTFRPGDDPRTHFSRWEDPAEYDRLQRKCWKAGFADTALEDGGHDVRFSERRLFPVRFPVRHYPIRSQAHGAQKVMHERRDRFADDEIAYGWHRQYDHVTTPDHLFLRNPALLRQFDLEALRLEAMLEAAEDTSAEPPERPPKVDPPPALGFLEHVSPRTISGWAGWVQVGASPVQVELWDGGRLIATVPAVTPRPDLAEHVTGGGFTIRTPRELLDGRPHWIWATVAETEVTLRRAPLVLHSEGRISIGSEQAPGSGTEPA